MKTSTKIYLILLLFILAGYLYTESIKKLPVDWFESYASNDKIPYGTYIFKNELTQIFPQTEVKEIQSPPYLYLEDQSVQGTYIFINSNLHFGDAEFFRLMDFVKRGNEVFMSTHGMLIDTLGVGTSQIFTNDYNQKPFFKLQNKAFRNREFSFDRFFDNQVFKKIDTVNTTVLGITGYINTEGNRVEEGINFIRLKHGKGVFYLHTFPEAFTNYHILNDETRLHTEQLMSYLNPDLPILYDAYYKNGKSVISSPMYYVLTNQSLKWAYYVLLIGVLFFIIFEGKRKQRAIEIIAPLKNQTLAFTRTIANMYFESEDHKIMAEEQITYFLEFIRNKLHIPTTNMNLSFYKFVAQRSQNSLDDTIALFKYCDQIHAKNTVTESELVELNKRIENFKNTIAYGKQ